MASSRWFLTAEDRTPGSPAYQTQRSRPQHMTTLDRTIHFIAVCDDIDPVAHEFMNPCGAVLDQPLYTISEIPANYTANRYR